MLLTKKNKKNP